MDQIVLITVDCLRSDHLGCYGYERPTSPNIDEFAASAMVYENSYANCPGTRWAFQSLHTGLPTLQISGLGIPEGYQPLASLFKNAGYRTGGFAVNGFVSREYGYDTGFDTFFSVQDTSSKFKRVIKDVGKWINRTLSNETVRDRVLLPVYDYLWSSEVNESQFQPTHSDADTVDEALDFLERNRGRPYFMWVHLMDAHTPYGHWPNHLQELRGDADIDHTLHPGRESRITVGEKPPANVIDTYDAGIRSVDEQINRLVRAISDDATVLITGDHGEEFGRYNEFHEASLHSSMTQVPIIIRDNEIGVGRSEMPAQHLDIPPTLLRAADIPIPDTWFGEALQHSDRNIDDPLFFSLDQDQVGIREGEWKYVESGNVSQLYNTPHGENDRDPVVDPERERLLAEQLKNYLESLDIHEKGRPSLEDDRNLDEAVEENLEDLGYL